MHSRERLAGPRVRASGEHRPFERWYRLSGSGPDLRWALLVGAWGLLYAIYRAYYAFGGLSGLPGVLRPDAHSVFQLINIIAVIVLLLGAAAPFLMSRLWISRLWLWCLAVCWVVAVGCIMHALIDIAQRVLSLAGLLAVSYPADLWVRVDRRAADLQDLLGNEPWFLIEGLLFAWLALRHVRGRSRLIFVISAAVAIAALVASGMLASTGHLGRVVVG